MIVHVEDIILRWRLDSLVVDDAQNLGANNLYRQESTYFDATEQAYEDARKRIAEAKMGEVT